MGKNGWQRNGFVKERYIKIILKREVRKKARDVPNKNLVHLLLFLYEFEKLQQIILLSFHSNVESSSMKEIS